MSDGEALASPLFTDGEWIPDLPGRAIGLTTARAGGTFGFNDPATSAPEVLARWTALLGVAEARGVPRLACAHQVHGTTIMSHGTAWRGWLRGSAADGQLALEGGVAMAVSIADCVPVFLVHPSGAGGVLHAGWRGTAGRILTRALEQFEAAGLDVSALRVHLGPSISGRVYEVGPEVHQAIRGVTPPGPTMIDLRAALADEARAGGVRAVTISAACTVTDQPRWFSHRAGDAGRQLGVLILPSP